MGRLNKPAQPGYKYRSPNQTNAKDLTPNLEEDVVASQRADAERIGKGLRAPAEREYNRRTQQEAGGRALSRSLGRAGMLSAAGMAGYDAGKAIDKEFPSIGKSIDKAVDKASLRGTRAKLTDAAKDRVSTEEAIEAIEEHESEKRRNPSVKVHDRGYAKGGKVSSASKRADGIAKTGKTRGRFV